MDYRRASRRSAADPLVLWGIIGSASAASIRSSSASENRGEAPLYLLRTHYRHGVFRPGRSEHDLAEDHRDSAGQRVTRREILLEGYRLGAHAVHYTHAQCSRPIRWERFDSTREGLSGLFRTPMSVCRSVGRAGQIPLPSSLALKHERDFARASSPSLTVESRHGAAPDGVEETPGLARKALGPVEQLEQPEAPRLPHHQDALGMGRVKRQARGALDGRRRRRQWAMS